ncbi:MULTISPECIES: histidine phosphatase family protein [unclassified Roseitalea]|uniref:histidine phosphatase family protein n=1 Tax=unclassified Roseitalea TaxID=2639107 RepID=UPI00273F67A0|nr:MULTISPECIES: histidine phosphatase family protein [unclassified Roseitalea]
MAFQPAHPFYMIRHGQTDWNREQRFQGHKDIPINETGRRQAAAYGRMLAAERRDWAGWRFVASPLSRASETMAILRRGLALDPEDFDRDDALMEVTYGQWEGHTLAELEPLQPELVAARETDKWTFLAPGGESYAMAAVRARRVLERLDGPAVIVTHGGIIRGTRHLLEGIDGNTAVREPVPQDNIYIFDGRASGWLR